MKKTIWETRVLLDALDIEIGRGLLVPEKKPRSSIGWKGPGVTFASRIPAAKTPAFSLGPEPQTVVTSHAHSAGLLLERIEKAFRPLLGSHIRFDFFERLAEAATEYSAFIPPDQDTGEAFLRVLLREARDILTDMEKGEFPTVHFEERPEDC